MSEGITREVELIINLYQARKEKAECKAELVAVTKELGRCGCYYIGEEDVNPCYMEEEEQLPRDEWCPACTGKQPAWEKYHAACGKAGGALRSLLAHGKKLDEGMS